MRIGISSGPHRELPCLDIGFETRFGADRGDGMPTGVDTGIRLVTPDASAAHADLPALGLSVTELLDWPTAPLMFSFCDPDGNRL
ncbi:MAG: hypothetical protein M3R01_07965 [Actinomycetota bacterium]|nr:hypothetical protein [Actinomycetota bacterium]